MTHTSSTAASRAEPENPPPNTLGLHRVMFAVADIDETIARLRAHGAELLGDVAQYESSFRSATSAAQRASSSLWSSRSADRMRCVRRKRSDQDRSILWRP